MKKNVLKIASIVLAGSMILSSCKKDDEKKPSGAYSNATFVVCEGIWTKNDGEIDAIIDGKVEKDIFNKVNNRILGDIVQNMTIIDDKAYIVVNNSGKVEVADAKTFESKGTIKGFSYPQVVVNRNDSEVFISNGDGYSNNYVYVVNKATLEKTDSTKELGMGPNAMIVKNNKLFVANFGGLSSDNKVSVIDVTSLEIENTITVGDMPSDMELDSDGNIIVVCKGATKYDDKWNVIGSTNSSIVKINTSTYETTTLKEFDHQLGSSGTNLLAYDGKIFFIDGSDLNYETYEYTKGAVYVLNGDNVEKFIDGVFYGVSINPQNGDIWTMTSSATSNYVSQYDKTGEFIKKYTVGNYPKAIVF